MQARRCGAQATTLPIILDGETVIQGSGAIIDWAEKKGENSETEFAPRGNLAEAREIERRADDVIGVNVRRLAYAATLPNCPHLVKPALFLRTSVSNRLIGNFMWPVTRRLMMRVYDIRPGAAAEVGLGWNRNSTGSTTNSQTAAPICLEIDLVELI